jgi:hypothetical protein
MLVKGQNQAAKALGMSRSYMSELSKKAGFPRRGDGLYDTDAIESFWRSVTDPARRKYSVSRSPNSFHVNGFSEVERIADPAEQAVARMMVHAAGAAMWATAWELASMGEKIEVAFAASRRVGRAVLGMLADEQAECGVRFLTGERIVFVPPEEWQVDFEEIAKEAGVTFDLDACLAYEAKLAG